MTPSPERTHSRLAAHLARAESLLQAWGIEARRAARAPNGWPQLSAGPWDVRVHSVSHDDSQADEIALMDHIVGEIRRRPPEWAGPTLLIAYVEEPFDRKRQARRLHISRDVLMRRLGIIRERVHAFLIVQDVHT